MLEVCARYMHWHTVRGYYVFILWWQYHYLPLSYIVALTLGTMSLVSC